MLLLFINLSFLFSHFLKKEDIESSIKMHFKLLGRTNFVRLSLDNKFFAFSPFCGMKNETRSPSPPTNISGPKTRLGKSGLIDVINPDGVFNSI